MAETIKIGGELESTATGNVVAAASAIKDKAKGKYQSQINAETDDTLAEHGAGIRALNSQNYVTVSDYASLPQSGQSADTVYRVSNYDGALSAVDSTKYSEYAWNGAQYLLLSVKSAIEEVFDVSEYNASGGSYATYTDLADLLANHLADIPPARRKGGMSIKFVLTSDNNYMQYRLMAQTFSTDEADWQGVDDEPTVDSKNLVESGGLYKTGLNKVKVNSDDELFDRSTTIFRTDLSSSTGQEVPSSSWNCSPYIPMGYNTIMWVTAYNNIVYVYDANHNYLGRTQAPMRGKSLSDMSSAFADVAYIRIIFNDSMIPTARVGLTEKENLIKDYFDYDDEPAVASNNLVESGGIYKAGLNKVKVNSDDELFDRSTTIFRTDLSSSNGQEVPSSSRNCSPYIPMGYNTIMWVTAYNNIVYVYDANHNYLGRTNTPMRGKSLSDMSSAFADVAYIRIIFNDSMIPTARVGLTEKENLIKDYFDYDEQPTIGSNALVLSDSLHNNQNNIFNLIAPIKNNGFGVFARGSNFITEVPLTGDVYVIDFITKISKYSNIDIYFKELVNRHNLKVWCAVYGSLGDAKKSVGTLEIERLTPSWATTNQHLQATKDGYVAINIQKNNSSKLSTQAVADVLRKLEINLNFNNESGYYIDDWTKGDWSNVNNPYLTERDYKLRLQDWLYLKKGTVINGYLYNSGRTVFVDIWNAATGVAVDTDTPRTSDFSITLDVDAKVMIVTATPDIQNPVASDQTIDIKIIENSPKNINNVSHLRIATFNVGDFSGQGISAGSDDAKTAYRQVIAKIGANIIATQEDNRYFNNTTQEPTKTALFDCFRYYFRSEIGNTPDANANTYGLCSDYFIENVRNVIFKFPYNTARFTHKFLQCGELVIDGKRVLLCNIHLDWDDTAIRREQISQLISYCSNYENVIILGDTNPDNYVDGELVQPYHPYEEEWAIFASAGYDLANGGYLGYFDTCDAGGGNWYPVDNIFTKGNIKIKNSYTITEEWMNDHKPVIAELVIY